MFLNAKDDFKMQEENDLMLKTAWKNASTRLRSAGINTPLLDARVLLQNVLNIRYEELLISASRILTEEERKKFENLLLRRLRREPVAKIIEEKEFWGAKFKTNFDTLDPRPETETIIEAILKNYKDKNRKLKILDLGTGSGCIIISLLREFHNATGLGVDVSLSALQVARENAENLQVSERLDFVQSNWFDSVNDKFDIIVSNPPYIKNDSINHLQAEVSLFEPKLALEGGEDGLDAYRKIIAQVENHLGIHGRCFFEIGKWQEEQVAEIIQQNGFTINEAWEDLAGIPRVISFSKKNLKIVK
ncbi:MAG: peptide chain release factor N(5)-glutamine methyltransferase [Rickettsiales bacterium]|nr:peptide chain release factor N(5)-glutamine methyltransferase [Rickettsiales bacterium]